jgi:hypothetical protein
MDSLHHDVDGRVEEFLGIFRVKVPNQLGGVFDVGKQDGDDLALTLKAGLGGQDFFSQVRRGVGYRGSLRLGGRRSGRF